MSVEQSPIPEELIVVRNSAFPLRVTGTVVLADLAALVEWHPEDKWQDIDIPAGCYSATVIGFRRVAKEVVEYGFEIVLSRTNELPKFTGSLTQDMQVLTLPE